MDLSTQKGIMLFFFLLSVCLIAIPLLTVAMRWLLRLKKVKRGGLGSFLIFSAFLLGSIWSLRFAVGYYTCLFPDPNQVPLRPWEELLNSAVHALQTMSMDEDYTEYIIKGKEMMVLLFGADSVWESFYGMYAAALNLVAPIAGGAMLFQILASIFPQMLLRISFLAFWKDKYYFSDLNEASVAVAKDIHRQYYPLFCRPVIVFTDAYTSDGNERSSELVGEAKALGAICVKDDLTHVPKSKRGVRKFFLIEEEEIRNLRELTQLASEKKTLSYLKGAEIVLFSQSDIYARVEQCVRKQWKVKADGSEVPDEDLPIITPIQRYRNLIHLLLDDIPLYEPLIEKPAKEDGTKELHVAILGTGVIGFEMFLSSYWFGQIAGCELHFHIVSQESEDSFWGRVDSLNPEIRRTLRQGDPILQYNRQGEHAAPYGQVEYTQCDVHSEEFAALLRPSAQGSLLQADYFLVALGTDEENMTVAEEIRQQLGRAHFVTDRRKQAVVAYVIFDTALSRTLNRQCHETYGQDQIQIYTKAVGDLEELYSLRNIFMLEYDTSADEIDRFHMARKKAEERFQEQRNRARSMIHNYNYWSSRARAMHRKYKAYAAGLFGRSIFDFSDTEAGEKAYENMVEQVRSRYRMLTLEVQSFATEKEKDAHLQLLHRLAWMEHRRWNAYARAKGFTNFAKKAPAGIRFVGNSGMVKHMELNFHGCLVETDQKGARAVLDPCTGQFDESTFLQKMGTDPDFLDELSLVREVEYKKYDYPYFDPYVLPKDSVNTDYTPNPISTSGVELPEALTELTELIAKNVHENWAEGRIAQGWVYGEQRNDVKKTTPCLIPYELLTEEEKAYDRRTAMQTLKLISVLGYRIVKQDDGEAGEKASHQAP